ncbi:hypothetical protein [Neotabrizicola sp. VNH66]|uniref:hypothetical protein n=1 Tax=Neotabrizicola sp. VNH66 TaxID=3400918 RepID=UPI003C0F6BCC
MIDYNLSLKNATDTDIEAALRAALKKYDKPKSYWPRSFWAGMIWGAVLIAAMDYGDVWLCAGQCQAMIEAARTAGKGE